MSNESKGLGRGDNKSRDLYILQALNRLNVAIAAVDGDLGKEATLQLMVGKLTAQPCIHNTISANASGSVPAGSVRGSVMNIGNTAGIWNGISLPTGVSIPWGEVGIRDIYAKIDYDATGTTFLIEYTTL